MRKRRSRRATAVIDYQGAPYAPLPGTYPILDPVRASFLAPTDTGAHTAVGELSLLIAGALSEIAFAVEAGPLSTWSN